MKNEKSPNEDAKSNEIHEGAAYDKVLKENALEIFKPVIEEHLGVKFTRFEAKPEKMQTTIEREMDFYHAVETDNEVFFYLHLEFQTEDEKDMDLRVGEYVAMARRRWKKPIKPIVIYLGKKPSKMRTTLPPEQVYTGFEMISVRDFCPFDLIKSDIPQMVILAVLCNYPEIYTEGIITMVITRLKEICTENQLNKFTNQLIILSRMRKLEKITAQKVDEMISYNVKEDGLYLMGVEATMGKAEIAVQEANVKAMQAEERAKRLEQEKIEMVKNLLELDVLTINDIAKVSNSTVAYVNEIKAKF